MEITLNTTPSGIERESLMQGQELAAAPSGELSPILGGDNLRVTGESDFEALLAKMEMDRDESRAKLYASRFASALQMLAGRYEGLNEAQKKVLDDISEATTAQIAAELKYQNAVYDRACTVSELEILNKKLEALLEESVTTPEDRKEEQIKELREKIAAKTDELEKLNTAVSAALSEKNAAAGAVENAMSKLDGTTAKVVFAAMKEIATEIVNEARNSKDEASAGKTEKANSIIAAIGEWADKLEEMQDEELKEKLGKLSVELQSLLREERLMKAEEMPGYEKNV